MCLLFLPLLSAFTLNRLRRSHLSLRLARATLSGGKERFSVYGTLVNTTLTLRLLAGIPA